MVVISIRDKNSKGRAVSELVHLVAVQYHEGLRVFPFFSFLIRALSLLDCKVAVTVLGNTCTFDTADRNQWAYFFAVYFNQRKPFPKCPHRLPLRFAAQTVYFLRGPDHQWQKKQH